MATKASDPLARERMVILALLLILATAAWGLLLWQATRPGAVMDGLTMGLSAPLFLAIWIVMMVAMMFPTAAPMIVMFARIAAGKRQQGQAFTPTWVFVSAYQLVWTLAGVLAYLGALAATALAEQSPWLMEQAPRLGGLVLVVAGLYQFSPLKQTCLAKCRTPIQFVLTAWRDGYGGAFQMGVAHGLDCLGCCWLLFVILFPLGMMNVAAMAVITLLIFAEKALPLGRQTSWVIAAGLMGYGLLVMLEPSLLPTMTMTGM